MCSSRTVALAARTEAQGGECLGGVDRAGRDADDERGARVAPERLLQHARELAVAGGCRV